MNRVRVASIQRRLAAIVAEWAELQAELADAYEDRDEQSPANDAPKPKRQRRAPPPPPGPVNPPTELGRAKARAAAQRLGHLIKVGR